MRLSPDQVAQIEREISDTGDPFVVMNNWGVTSEDLNQAKALSLESSGYGGLPPDLWSSPEANIQVQSQAVKESGIAVLKEQGLYHESPVAVVSAKAAPVNQEVLGDGSPQTQVFEAPQVEKASDSPVTVAENIAVANLDKIEEANRYKVKALEEVGYGGLPADLWLSPAANIQVQSQEVKESGIAVLKEQGLYYDQETAKSSPVAVVLAKAAPVSIVEQSPAGVVVSAQDSPKETAQSVNPWPWIAIAAAALL